MANSTEAPYSVTFRSPKGTLITVRGETAEELGFNLAHASLPIDPEGATVLGMIAEIDGALSGVGEHHGQHEAPQGQQQGSLNPTCPTCGGPTTEKSGTGAKGPWRGYFCPTKGHQVTWAAK